METTEFTTIMKDFLESAATSLKELECAVVDLEKNPVKSDKTKFTAQTPKKIEMSQDDIDAKIIELSKKARKVPSANFTGKVKKECGLDKTLAEETIQRLIKEGRVQEKEIKEKESK